ncbi:MAG: metallophosphoesterase [Chlorobi bacterium]|nr:MAG: metallophosphoesterase [Chlorobi bacterium OLB7]MBK8912093.1 metallophosphoesterase [Chlorobiota bacterium]MBX7217132.1 metallophosphoesterase [Candidatus Kapabacteria bacterium]
MQRRSFLKQTALATAGIFAATSVAFHEKLFALWSALGGNSEVKGAKPIPNFTPFDIPNQIGMRFLIIGDWGTGASGQARVANSMLRTAKEYGCDYVISTGDNIYPKGVQSAEDPQWERKFVKMYHDRGLTQPFFPTLGNHDYGFVPEAQVEYSKKNPQWRMPSRYYTQKLTAPDGTTVQLFSLDTQLVQTAVAGAAAEQSAWLDRELEKSDAQWKIVFGHHMLYSNGIYGNLKRMRDAFEKVLVKHNVRLYLCGHDHDIQLLKPVDGVSYVVSGGGGGHRDTSWKENTIYAATNMGYVWMAITSNGIHLHFHDADGVVKYAHRLG